MTRTIRIIRGAQSLLNAQPPRHITKARFIRQYSDYIPSGTTLRTTVNELAFVSPSQTSPQVAKWVEIPPSGATVQVGQGLEATSNGLAFSSVIGAEGAKFSHLFLRDSCQCAQCVDHQTGQKRFQTANIPHNIEIQSVRPTDSEIEIKWRNDHADSSADHRTRFSVQELQSELTKPSVTVSARPVTFWDGDSIKNQVRRTDYNDFLQDDKAFCGVLEQLHDQGLTLITGVPESEVSVEEIVERIGPLEHTFYGKTWDVRDKPDARNVAYTSHFLGMHMDLLYMKQPPGLQFLHCLKSSCKGGESMFADSFYAAGKLHHTQPELFTALATTPVTYKYDHATHQYIDHKPTIELVKSPFEAIDQRMPPSNPISKLLGAAAKATSTPAIANVNWSPPFQGRFQPTVGAEELRLYHRAAAAFADIVDDPSNQFRVRLNPGECVIFNNRRVLHGRTAFISSSGERWLKGAYLDTQDFVSALRVMEMKMKGAAPVA